jgi:hypothetical protein
LGERLVPHTVYHVDGNWSKEPFTDQLSIHSVL